MLQENFKQVEENIRKACERAGRDPKEVTLIAVSKNKTCGDAARTYDFGNKSLWREQGAGDRGEI